MKKLINLYIFLILLLAVFIIMFTQIDIVKFYPEFLLKLTLQVKFTLFRHQLAEWIATFLFVLIFLKTNKLYSKTKDKRMAIIAGSFLVSIFLNIYFLIYSPSFPYDMITVENMRFKPAIFYLLATKIITAAAIFTAVFYTKKSFKITYTSNNFRFKTYLLFFCMGFLVFILDKVVFPLLPYFIYYRVLLFEHALDGILGTIYFVILFIWADRRRTCHKNIVDAFLLSMLALGIWQIYYVVVKLHYISGIAGHIIKTISYGLLYFGLEKFQKLPESINIRQKLLTYLALYLIILYLIFSLLIVIIFKINISVIFICIFTEFVLTSLLLQYILAAKFTLPILNITTVVNKYNPGEKLEIPIISDDEIGLLTDRINKIISLNWEYMQNIKIKQEKETFLREIINNILTSKNLEDALNLICAEIGQLFDAERVKIRLFDKEENVFSNVVAEYRKNEQIPSLIGTGKYSKEFSEYMLKILIEDKKLFIVNDIENNTIPKYIKEIFKLLSSRSIIEAPILYKDKLLASVIIVNTTKPKEWEQEKLDLLNPICQQIAIGINLFNLNEELKLALGNEKALRQITDEINLLKTYEEIDNYTLSQLLKIFKVERAIHFHFIEDSIIITNEKTLNENIVNLKESWKFTRANLKELIIEPGLFITINDVESEIKSEELKEYLRSQNINSFIIYPTIKMILKDELKEIIELTMLANPINHNWTEYEKNLLQLIIDTIAIISLKILQKEEIEEIKQTFIATLTHDLRSPILAEQKALEAMISKRIDCSGEYLQDIYKTNEDLLKLVNNMLSVYHYETGRPILNKIETNIKELIEDSVITLKYLAADKESQIYFNIQENLPLINIDRDEINRVFSNLIGNAIKHTKRETQIQINAYRKNNNIEFAIQDNGEGISKEQIPIIFHRYPTTKRKIGTGLGLYLSKQIIEAHNGKIWFETEEGTGTTFYFTLPI